MKYSFLKIIGIDQIRKQGWAKVARTVLITTIWTLVIIFGPFAFDTKDLEAPASIAPIDDSKPSNALTTSKL